MIVNWLRTEIARRGIAQRELADAIGLTESQLSKVFGRARQLRADELVVALRYLGYPAPPYDAGISTVAEQVHAIAAGLDAEQQRALLTHLRLLRQMFPAR